MYKILIVDDERMIREGIRRLIPWERMGIGEVFTADSGGAALDVIAARQPDILLTDLCMDEMDGLTLIRQVNALRPGMRIVVLTGYDNFEYVRQCCRMEVHDFLLKPVEEAELSGVIAAQVAALDKRADQEQYQRVMRRVQGMAEQLRLEQAMRGLVHGRMEAAALAGLFAEYSYRKDQPLQAVIIVPTLEADASWRDHADLLALSIKNSCIELFDSGGGGITFEDDGGQIVIAMFTGSAFDEPVERMASLSRFLRTEYEILPRIVMGGGVSGFGELALSYNDALLLLGNAPVDGEIIQSGAAERRLRSFSDAFGELRRIIAQNAGDLEKALRAFTAFSRATESYNLSDSMVRRCCFEIAGSAYYSYIGETGEAVDNKLPVLLGSLMVCSREEACALTGGFIRQIFGGGAEQSHEIIARAKRYIAEHLADELSVSSIAAWLYITPNYFSRLFKRVTGQGCNDYIVRTRMESAKSLLESTSIKTGIIAGMVGYRDTNYFSLAFKKHTGTSPTSYRRAGSAR